MFRAMFSPIIRSTWLYLRYLVMFTQVAVGWCLEWFETEQCGLWGVKSIPSQLYVFRAMFSPIIRSTWLYLQYLVMFTQVAVGWCLEWVETELCGLWGVHCTLHNPHSSVQCTPHNPHSSVHCTPHNPHSSVHCTPHNPHSSISTHSRHQPTATWVNITRYCKYSQVLLMMGENITRNM
jgi:hypothetical protein